MATDGSNAYDPSDYLHDASSSSTEGYIFSVLYYPSEC